MNKLNPQQKIDFFKYSSFFAGMLLLVTSFQRSPAQCQVDSSNGTVTAIEYRLPFAGFLAIAGLGLMTGTVMLSRQKEEEIKKETLPALNPTSAPVVRMPIDFKQPELEMVQNSEFEEDFPLPTFLQVDTLATQVAPVSNTPDFGRVGELIERQKSAMLCSIPGTGKSTTLAVILEKIFLQTPNAKIFVCSVKNDSFRGLKGIEWKLEIVNRKGEIETIWEPAVRMNNDPIKSRLPQFCELINKVVSSRLQFPEENRGHFPNEPIWFIIDDATGQYANLESAEATIVSKTQTNLVCNGREAACFLLSIVQDPNVDSNCFQSKAIRGSMYVMSLGLDSVDSQGKTSGGFNSIRESIDNKFLTPPESRISLQKDLEEMIPKSKQNSIPILYDNLETFPQLNFLPDCREFRTKLIDFSRIPVGNYRKIGENNGRPPIPPMPPKPPGMPPKKDFFNPSSPDESVFDPRLDLERMYITSPDAGLGQDGQDDYPQRDSGNETSFSLGDWERYFPELSPEAAVEKIKLYGLGKSKAAKGETAVLTVSDVAKTILSCNQNNDSPTRSYHRVGKPAVCFLVNKYGGENVAKLFKDKENLS